MGPVTDRASRLLGWLTGHGDDLDDLLGTEGGGPAGARGIIKDPGDQAEELGVGEVVVLGLSQSFGGVQPTVTPETDGDPIEAEVSGGGLEAGIGGQGEQDEDAADQPLRSGLPVTKLFQ